MAPLDWGLGHTTRCIPLIRHLQQLGHYVIFAGNDGQRAFVSGIVADLELVHLDGYHVSYATNDKLSTIKLLSQIPGITKTIKKEHNWLLKQAKELSLDGIISDNRYGLYHPGIPSVILTHQLVVQTGMGKQADRMLQKVHYEYLERFNEVWVPDVKGEGNLAGALSQTERLPESTHYIGLLSQFVVGEPVVTEQEYLLVLLSGPEPQRTILAGILWQQLAGNTGKVVFVAGKKGEMEPAAKAANILFYDILGGDALGNIIKGANAVICRSGYSTIMDLLLMDKKAILIPTPGQTEQEYLANHLQEQGIFVFAEQRKFDLNDSLTFLKNSGFRVKRTNIGYSKYKFVLENWLLNMQ